MKAAVCYEFNQPLRIEEVEIDPPGKGEVKVRLAATAICHSDIHLMRGDWAGALPVIPGHEAAGVVAEVGDGVTAIAPGDRVVVSLLRSCGRCFQCTSGSSHSCEGVFALDTESRFRNARGEPVQHGIKTAAFAEYTVVDQSQLVAIPAEMPLDRAALLGCGVITGIGAVLNTARVGPGQSVVVIGAGGVGLNAIQGAVLSAAKPIIAVDRVETKLEAARRFGATDALNGASMETREVAGAVRKLTAGRGADHVFVTVGSPAAVTQALALVRRGGTVVVVGMPALLDTAAVRVFDLVWNEKKLIGSRMGATRLRSDVPRLVEHYLAGRVLLDELISGRFALEQINEAIAGMESGQALRNVIVFDEKR